MQPLVSVIAHTGLVAELAVEVETARLDSP